jgi:hypothetical protein
VGVGEVDTASRQSVDVWRQRLRGRFEVANLIVHVVDGDEEDIGGGEGGRQKEAGGKEEETPHIVPEGLGMN